MFLDVLFIWIHWINIVGTEPTKQTHIYCIFLYNLYPVHSSSQCWCPVIRIQRSRAEGHKSVQNLISQKLLIHTFQHHRSSFGAVEYIQNSYISLHPKTFHPQKKLDTSSLPQTHTCVIIENMGPLDYVTLWGDYSSEALEMWLIPSLANVKLLRGSNSNGQL